LKKAGLIVNINKDADLEITKKLISVFNKNGISLLSADEKLRNAFGTRNDIVSEDELIKTAEALFCLGGDGTLLNVAGKMLPYNIPLMGINLGHLGFLTEIDEYELEHKISFLADDEYDIEKRIMIDVSLFIGEKLITGSCLNDFVVSRGASPRLIDIKAYIDDCFVDSFNGDGVIVSTPTGSTAYSLSCGGPIADPAMKVMLITPVCPHNIYSRTFLVDIARTIRLEAVSKKGCFALCTFDGQDSYEIDQPVKAYIKTSEKELRLIRLNKRNFYDVLRKKLYNRG